MNTPEFVKFEVTEGVGTLTINRESKLNALNRQVLEELKTHLSYLRTLNRNELLGLILIGAGEKAFIAGADIAELAKFSSQEASDVSKLGQEVSLLLERFNRPVIACVNGHAMGGGLEMAISCDILVMTPKALLALPEVKLGLIPGFGGTQRLAKIVGRMRAKELIYSGRVVNAEEALSIGLCLKILPNRQELWQWAFDWIKLCSQNSLLAISSAKKCLLEGMDVPTSEGLKVEADHFAHLFGSNDMKEGTSAFLEKRAATFRHQ